MASSRDSYRVERVADCPTALLPSRAIWKEVFQDLDPFIDLYFSEVATPQNTLWVTDPPHTAAQVQMLRYRMEYLGRSFRAGYISGLATRASYRQRGIALQLMQAAHHTMQLRGDALSFLIPANPTVERYYGEHLGYTSCLSLVAPMLALPPSLRRMPLAPSPEAYLRFDAWARSLSQEGLAPIHSYAQWRVVVRDLELSGGGLFSDGEGDYYLSGTDTLAWHIPYPPYPLQQWNEKAQGMLRILDPLALLQGIAPQTEVCGQVLPHAFRYLDPHSAQTSGLYLYRAGRWLHYPQVGKRMSPTLSPEELAQILFPSAERQRIFLLLQ